MSPSPHSFPALFLGSGGPSDNRGQTFHFQFGSWLHDGSTLATPASEGQLLSPCSGEGAGCLGNGQDGSLAATGVTSELGISTLKPSPTFF